MRGNGQRLRRWLTPWVTLMGVLSAFFLVYRWAIYYKLPLPSFLGGDQRPLIRLENATFTATVDSRSTWSLHAKVIEFDRQPGAALSNIRSANITQISDGMLYSLPTPSVQSSSDKMPLSKKVATFYADKGEYTLGQQGDLPYDLALLYTLKWKFIMSGSVGFKTDSGIEMKTPHLILMELQQSGKPRLEQRILCNQGASFTHKEVTLYANSTRFNLSEQLIECVDGVRATFKEGTIQTDKMYWSVRSQQLYCPGTVTGRWHEIPFIAENMTIDLKNRDYMARHIDLTLPSSLEKIGESIKQQRGK
ncbi:MAG: hypothetical protein NT023_13840 [Armatimonadetes bacterium]|nr:hypothetical protein [Armatimonadota bacterium]